MITLSYECCAVVRRLATQKLLLVHFYDSSTLESLHALEVVAVLRGMAHRVQQPPAVMSICSCSDVIVCSLCACCCCCRC